MVYGKSDIGFKSAEDLFKTYDGFVSGVVPMYILAQWWRLFCKETWDVVAFRRFKSLLSSILNDSEFLNSIIDLVITK